MQGCIVSMLAIEHGAPERRLAGTDAGVWKLRLLRGRVLNPIPCRLWEGEFSRRMRLRQKLTTRLPTTGRHKATQIG